MAEVLDYLRSVSDLDGECWECGVHEGRTSAVLATEIRSTRRRTLRLFDTFCGRPPKHPLDTGTSDTDFTDTSLAAVRERVTPTTEEYEFVRFHVGVIPHTFHGLEASRIAFAYVDLDLYQSTHDAMVFVLPRMVPGGVILIDDYDEPIIWPGVRLAVDALTLVTTMAVHRAVIGLRQINGANPYRPARNELTGSFWPAGEFDRKGRRANNGGQ